MKKYELLSFIGPLLGCTEAMPPPASPEVGAPVASPAPQVPPPADSVTGSGPTDGAPSTSAPAKLAPPETPDAIKAPSGNLVLKANAKGIQIYTCAPSKDDKSKLEWTLKAPEATLSDDAGKSIGKHYAGPTWEAEDGSKVVGAMKAKVDAPEATAIPWLLVEAKASEGQGVLGHVTWVQRVQTAGGKAPSSGCDKKTIGAESRIDYTATYYFYAP